jgi:C4-dicarboxylate-specific signal transduction histidine kinase
MDDASPFKFRPHDLGVRQWLAILVVGCILPLSGMAAFLIFNFYQHEQIRLISNAIQQAHAISAEVDRDIVRTEAALQVLATSSSFVNADFSAFYPQATKALQSMRADSIVVVDITGQLLLSTSRPFGEALPKLTTAPLLERIQKTGQPGVSDLYIGPLVNRFIYTVTVPIKHNEITQMLLSASSTPAPLFNILNEKKFPASWRVSVVDSSGTIVARTHDMEKFLGRKIKPVSLQKIRTAYEGSFRSENLSGVSMMNVYSRSPTTQWTIVMGIPFDEMTEELRYTLYWLIVVTIVALSAGLVFAWFVGGNIAQSIIALIQSATVIGSDDILPIPYLHFREANQLGRALQDTSNKLWQSQISLREKDLQLTQAAEAVKLGIWIFDFAENKIWASDQWRVLFCFSGVETIEIGAVLSRIHPDDLVAVRQTVMTLTPPNLEYDIEYRLQLPEGGIRWIASRGRIDYASAGHALRIRAVSFDITLRKQAELDLQQKKIEIIHLSRVVMLGELSGALAHELNQPLTSILSNAQAAQRFLAKDDVDLNEVRDILQDIVDEDKRAGEVIRRLRGLLTSGEIQAQSVDVNYLVSEVGKLLRSDLITQGVELHMECAADLKRINADPVQLQQVMINLIMNACDAIKTGKGFGRRIVVRTGFYDADNAEVAVIDQGAGIAPGNLEKIFGAFYTTKENGMGLGLSICRNIIEANGGRIWAENDPGHGASFHFCLPLCSDETP